MIIRLVVTLTKSVTVMDSESTTSGKVSASDTEMVSMSVTWAGAGPELVAAPESATICVLPAATLLLSVMVRVPVSAPVAVGVKVTLIVQGPPASYTARAVVGLAEVGAGGDAGDGERGAARVAQGDRLRCARGPHVLTAERQAGREDAATGAVPVPVKPTDCGLSGALSLKISVALRLPVAIGVNVTLMVQVLASLGEGMSVAPVQVSALVAKSLESVPPIKAVAMVRLAEPVFVMVQRLRRAGGADVLRGKHRGWWGEGLSDGSGVDANFMMKALFPLDKADL